MCREEVSWCPDDGDGLRIWCGICSVPVEDVYDAVGAFVRDTGMRDA
jgi:hypothetical protein